MIIDCFTFFNELDMLEYRLTVVPADKVVLVEATKTYSGKDKELFYEKNKSRFQTWADKIIHVIVDDFPETNDSWVRERFQRNAIQRGLDQISLSDSDTILISDVDEIPNPKILFQQYSGLYALYQDAYYYNLTCVVKRCWLHPRIMNWGTYLTIGFPQHCRTNGVHGIIENGGWHLSYFGSTEFIKTKLESFSHTEYSGEHYTNTDHIKDSILTYKDLNSGRQFSKLSIQENDNLPPNHELILELFR
jgi:beta-1,4-mannosyl-glycoprotein beta-1,4-N-acetylglucosaminyltransferase